MGLYAFLQSALAFAFIVCGVAYHGNHFLGAGHLFDVGCRMIFGASLAAAAAAAGAVSGGGFGGWGDLDEDGGDDENKDEEG